MSGNLESTSYHLFSSLAPNSTSHNSLTGTGGFISSVSNMQAVKTTGFLPFLGTPPTDMMPPAGFTSSLRATMTLIHHLSHLPSSSFPIKTHAACPYTHTLFSSSMNSSLSSPASSPSSVLDHPLTPPSSIITDISKISPSPPLSSIISAIP